MTNMKDFFNWVQAQQNNSMTKMEIDYQNRNQKKEDTEDGIRTDTGTE
mgnify:CR=1 FL=1